MHCGDDGLVNLQALNRSQAKSYSTEAPSNSPTLILNARGFSQVIFNLSEFTTSNNILKDIITILRDKLSSLKRGNTILIIARFKYDEGSVRTIHKSQVISLNNQFISVYSTFLKEVLSMKSNDYHIDESEIREIFFDFFFIDPDKIQTKWNNLNLNFQLNKETINFRIGSNLSINLPSNMNYHSCFFRK